MEPGERVPHARRRHGAQLSSPRGASGPPRHVLRQGWGRSPMKLTRRQLLTVLTAGSAATVASCTLGPAPPRPAPSVITPTPQPPHLGGTELGSPRSPLSAAASRWQPAPG